MRGNKTKTRKSMHEKKEKKKSYYNKSWCKEDEREKMLFPLPKEIMAKKNNQPLTLFQCSLSIKRKHYYYNVSFLAKSMLLFNKLRSISRVLHCGKTRRPFEERKGNVENTSRRRVFSTFLECSQMSGVFYYSAIQGLGFFICFMM